MTTTKLRHEVGKNTTLVGLIILLILITVGAVFFHLIEGHTWFDSLYFVIMTMTTVGLGDIVPSTYFGKILAMLYAVMGAPLFIFLTGVMVEQRITGLVKSYVKHHTHQVLHGGADLNDEIATNHEESPVR